MCWKLRALLHDGLGELTPDIALRNYHRWCASENRAKCLSVCGENSDEKYCSRANEFDQGAGAVRNATGDQT